MTTTELLSNIGGSVSFSKQIYPMVKKCVNKNVCQFFLGSTFSFKRTLLHEDDIKKTQTQFPHFQLFIHAPYVYNLAGQKNILGWTGDLKIDTKLRLSIKSLEYELYVSSLFHGGVIIHPGNHVHRSDGLQCIAKSINMITFPKNSKLLLENCAGCGTSLCDSFDEISTVIGLIDNVNHVGVCLDTAHIQGTGLYDLSKKSEVDRMYNEFEEKIGLEKLHLIHLNDSHCKLGKKRDLHACLTKGNIWSGEDGKDVLAYLVNKFSSVCPFVIENDQYVSDFKLLEEIL